MSNLHDWTADVRRASHEATPEFHPEVARLVYRRVQQQKKRGAIVRGASVVAVAAIVTVAALFMKPAAVIETPRIAWQSQPLIMSDGTRIVADSERTQLNIIRDTGDAMTVLLLSGTAHFDVTPRPERRFEVIANDVTVSVLGTLFSVTRDASGVAVAVESGKVRVDRRGEQNVLIDGDDDFFPARSARQAITLAKPVITAKKPSTKISSAKPAPKAPDANAFTQALAHADALRLIHRDSEAVDVLLEAIAAAPNDPRACVAMFAVARLQMDALDDSVAAEQTLNTLLLRFRECALREEAIARLEEAHTRNSR